MTITDPRYTGFVATIDELREHALKLPQEEREQLAIELLDSLDDTGMTPEEHEKACADEIRRRIDDVESGRVQPLSEEEAMKIFES